MCKSDSITSCMWNIETLNDRKFDRNLIENSRSNCIIKTLSSQSAFTFSKLAIKTLEQSVKSAQS